MKTFGSCWVLAGLEIENLFTSIWPLGTFSSRHIWPILKKQTRLYRPTRHVSSVLSWTAGFEPWPRKWWPLQGVLPLSNYTRVQALWSARKMQDRRVARKRRSTGAQGREFEPWPLRRFFWPFSWLIGIMLINFKCLFCPGWAICESVNCMEFSLQKYRPWANIKKTRLIK